jgi:hypothetical protein
MGDPVGAVRHIRERIKPDGTLMLVEPMAGDSLSENLNPVGRIFYVRLDRYLHTVFQIDTDVDFYQIRKVTAGMAEEEE